MSTSTAPPLGGIKHDQGKDPWHLLPTDAVRAIIKVLAFGATKYAPRNWEAGFVWSRPYDALLRHLTAWWEGEKADPETGFSHLWHAGCCILFLIAFELRGVGGDDRPKPASVPAAPPPLDPKDCHTCRFERLDANTQPCFSCELSSEWKPKS